MPNERFVNSPQTTAARHGPAPAPVHQPTLRMAVVGAGPVGLSLALHAARALPQAQVTVFDSRAADADVATDPRTLALSLGSVQVLQRLGVWQSGMAQPITEVHVSQQMPSLGALFGNLIAEPQVRIRAADAGVAMLGAVLSYGTVTAALQHAWLHASAACPQRLISRFATPVRSLNALHTEGATGVEVDADIAEGFDLAVIAEGGVFADQARKAITRDYGQVAWVGRVTLAGARDGVAFERFTRHGPAALLPLGPGSAALVWCVDASDDPVSGLNDAQRCTVLNTIFPAEAGRITAITPLKSFALGLNAERSLTDGVLPGLGRLIGKFAGGAAGNLVGEPGAPGRIVRIGNAAQTLHPVAGQGLNLGLRDAFVLVQQLARGPDVDQALRRLEFKRAPDRWATIAATDFLARSFTWSLPGAGIARGVGLAAVQAVAPLKAAVTRQMMFGRR
jgi:2-octaprenyl-6-methoxyphenol hydroxylase